MQLNLGYGLRAARMRWLTNTARSNSSLMWRARGDDRETSMHRVPNRQARIVAGKHLLRIVKVRRD
jgi:hypothetical protein